jgi:peptidoglycan glycosyltransferase
VNTPIVRLYVFVLLLFAALVGFTSYWSVFDSNTLKAETANRRPLIQEQQVRRGFIKTSDGVTVAESHPEGGKNPVYVRDYPQGSLYGNPVGYSFVQVGQSGIEKSENSTLAGERNEFTSILDQLRGIPQEGDNVTLTIDSHMQQVATQALQQAISSNGLPGVGGSVVALDPSTGAVKAMVSLPGYAERLSARLDDEGGYRRRRARLGTIHPQHDAHGELPDEYRGRPAVQRQRPGLRLDRHDHGADEFGQHLLRAGR